MGAAIGAVLAAEDENIASLVMLAPYLRIPRLVALALRGRRLWDPFVGEVRSRHPRSILDPEERAKSLAYGVVNARAMGQLARVVRGGRAALPKIAAPTLIIQSRNDPRVTAATAKMVVGRIGSHEKRLVWADDGGHVITVDYGREEILAETVDWISRWSRQPH